MPADWKGPTKPPSFEEVSKDDLTWVNPVSIEQVTSLIQNPAKWIKELNALDPNDKVVTLRPDFVLRLQLRGRRPAGAADCLVQGIVGTSVITVRPQLSFGEGIFEAKHKKLFDRWLDYWTVWKETSELLVLYDEEANQAYGHLELTAPGDTAAVRSDKIVAFLMLAADPKAIWDGTYFLNHILQKTPRYLTKVPKGGKPTRVTPVKAVFNQIPVADPSPLLNVNFTLIANQEELSSLEAAPKRRTPPPPPPPVACDNMAGEWNPQTGTATLDDIVVKNYAK